MRTTKNMLLGTTVLMGTGFFPGAGAGNPPAGQQGNAGTETPPDNNNVEITDGFWDDIEKEVPANSQQPQPQFQQPQLPQNPNEQIDAFWKDQGIEFKLDPRDMQEMIQNNDFKGLTEGINDALKQTFLTAIARANNLAQVHANKAAETAFAKVNSTLSTRDHRAHLSTAFPELYEDTATRNILEGTYSQALRRAEGDTKRATELTERMMLRLATKASEAFNARPNSSTRQVQPILGGRPKQQETDWMGLFADS